MAAMITERESREQEHMAEYHRRRDPVYGSAKCRLRRGSKEQENGWISCNVAGGKIIIVLGYAIHRVSPPSIFSHMLPLSGVCMQHHHKQDIPTCYIQPRAPAQFLLPPAPPSEFTGARTIEETSGINASMTVLPVSAH